VWIGVTISYAAADIPPSFAIVGVAASILAASFVPRH